MRRGAALLALLLATPACSDGQSGFTGLTEPFRVRGAQFIKGTLPGTAPVPAGTQLLPGDPPRVVGFTISNLIVNQGEGGKKLTARLTTGSASAGFALAGLGTGWWLLPAGDLDGTTNPPSLSVAAVGDFSDEVPLGPAKLVGVAFDANGVAGPQYDQNLCVASDGPAGASSCPGGALPAAAAITLTWDTQVDLDLQVLTPDGTLVTPKHPNVEDPDKKQLADPTKPRIDRDSNPNCAIDGARREMLIWPTDPSDPAGSEVPSGIYGVYVNLYSACGQQAVHFHVQVSTAVPGPPDADAGAAGAGGDDASNLVEHVWLDESGELIAAQASPSAPTGLFVTEFNF